MRTFYSNEDVNADLNFVAPRGSIEDVEESAIFQIWKIRSFLSKNFKGCIIMLKFEQKYLLLIAVYWILEGNGKLFIENFTLFEEKTFL